MIFDKRFVHLVIAMQTKRRRIVNGTAGVLESTTIRLGRVVTLNN